MPGKAIQAIVLDIDGTVLGKRWSVSDRTVAAVQRACAAGLPVVLATSRGPRGIRPIQQALGLLGQPFVAYQGAIVARYHPAKGRLQVLTTTAMSTGMAREVLHLAEPAGFTVCWYAGEDWYVRRINQAVSREARITGETPQPAALEALPRAPHKLLCIGSAGPSIQSRIDKLMTYLPSGTVGRRSSARYLEVTVAGADKPVGVATLARHRGWCPENLLAIGDGENDLGLFGYVGVSVAMGNAPPSVTQAATYRTGTNLADGVADVLDAVDDARRLRVPVGGTFGPEALLACG